MDTFTTPRAASTRTTNEPLTRLERFAVATSYEDFQETIRVTVLAFAKRFGGRVDGYMADCNLIFVEAHRDFPRWSHTRTTYEGNLRKWIWNELLDARRVQLSRNKKLAYSSASCELAMDGDTMHLDDATLSIDARLALRLVIDAPADLRRTVAAKGDQPRNWRSTIRQHLIDMGWTTARVNESFDEIREAL